ncbi:MAG: hypothetical protein WBN50_12685 [Lutimonas sp.]
MPSFSVRDGRIKQIQFDGDMLAEMTSRRRGAPRWTEMRLYKTDGGTYVLEKIGVSTVVHEPDCPDLMTDLPRFQAEYPGQDPFNSDFWLHEECMSDAADTDITALVVEENRYWATVAEDPADIVDSLYRRKDGTKTLQRMSVDLLEQASAKDDGIRKAYGAEYIL